MDGTLKIWLVIFAVGALNYASRLSFIAAFGRRSMPAWLARSLRFVPAAMLTALVLPMIVGTATTGASTWANPRAIAAVVAGAVAFFTRSTPKTLVAGMAALWLLQWLRDTHG